MKVEIPNETYNKIKKFVEGNTFYKDRFTIDEMINCIINIGWYAYKNDGFDGSVHPDTDGSFTICN